MPSPGAPPAVLGGGTLAGREALGELVAAALLLDCGRPVDGVLRSAAVRPARWVNKLAPTAAAAMTAIVVVARSATRRTRTWPSLPGCSVMVLEVGIIDVQEGAEAQFATAYRGVREVLAGTPGVHSVRMTHGIERPTRYVLLVEWESVEAHEQNFRGTDRFTQWRAAIGPYFAQPPLVEHYEDVD